MSEISRYCRHYECRCTAVDELIVMCDALHRDELLTKAIKVYWNDEEVRCRHVPRRGPGQTIVPFAPEDGIALHSIAHPPGLIDRVLDGYARKLRDS